MRLSAALLLPLLTSTACVLDRTGQSASETWHREMLLQRTRSENLEAQYREVEARIDQLEELTRARGQEEIMRMETLDQLRTEVARIRGEVEVLNHDVVRKVDQGAAQAEDAAFRLVWLESRADQLEAALGLEPPPPPTPAEDGAEEPVAEGGDTGGEPAETAPEGEVATPMPEAEAVTEPGAMIALAEEHLAAGRHKAAEAVLARFVELHPEHERVAEARYRHAEAAFNGGEYQAAVLRFQEVIDRHKDSPWAPWAMLRQGECFEKQGQAENARLFYEDVVRIWPKSKAAKEARDRM